MTLGASLSSVTYSSP